MGKQQHARNRAKRKEGEVFTNRVSGLFRKTVLQANQIQFDRAENPLEVRRSG
jgi:hypothetical protein